MTIPLWDITMASRVDTESTPKLSVDSGPFIDGDRVVGAIANGTVIGRCVCTTHALQVRTQPFDRTARGYVARVGLEGDPQHSPYVESVGQLQPLDFGIDPVALC